MKIETWRVPQADNVLRLFDVLEEIAGGRSSDEEIAKYCELPSRRQGGYYRLAAQSVGLIKVEGQKIVPTLLGKSISDIESTEVRLVLMRAIVLINPAVRAIYEVMEDCDAPGVDIKVLLRRLMDSSELSYETAKRRLDTIVRWLVQLKMAKRRRSTIWLVEIP